MIIRVGIIFLLFCFHLFLPQLKAQEPKDSMKTVRIRHELGFAAGTSISYGPAYKIRLNRWAGMATFAPFIRYNVENYFAGLSFQYMLQSTPVSNFFVYQGNRMMSRTRYNTTWDLPPFSPIGMKETKKEYLFSHGIGLGYEMFSRPEKKNPLALSLMTGWAVYDNFRSGMFSVEMSVLYKFRRN